MRCFVSRLFPALFLPCVLAVLLPAAPFCGAQTHYHIVERWTIGGQGGWDYLRADGPAHRLYVTHNSRVEAIDTRTGKVVGAVTGLKGTHGVALDSDGRTGYITDGGGDAIVVFDRRNLSPLAVVPAGGNPDGVAYEPATRTVWVFNGRSRDASVLDAPSRTIIDTVPLPGKPEFPAAGRDGQMFVNIQDKNEILRIDARTHAIQATWPLQGCESPTGLAYDPVGQRLFTVCYGGKMNVLDAQTGRVIATPSIGAGPDAARYDVRRRLAFSSNGGSGTLTVIDAGKPSYPVAQSLATEQGARTMALDETTGRIYLATAKFGARPAATPAMPQPRPSIVPGSFEILVVAP